MSGKWFYTRIIYDRKFLMECRNSPVTKTPPRDLPTIPGVTSPVGHETPTEASQDHLSSSPEDKPAGGEWPGSARLSLGKGMRVVASAQGEFQGGERCSCLELPRVQRVRVGTGV